ncbi:MAG: hypothetical protein OEV73_10555 [Desulfobulbaceae bacterium]|nr:hypothetical protein [Desulfobulbaceae bacterium]
MSGTEELLPAGEKVRKALRWLSESLQTSPEKGRLQTLREAELRFDLSPAECRFLDERFGDACRDSSDIPS